ncbi:MAG TPA: GMP synthase (glutamine-hydrolyzing), partial [Gammaproteobacteria bacterium]|nr:GMP synthase (glutamine-hydrolyzing) [Gammaproteobacteria bacterium]
LGICYGMQAMAKKFGGEVAAGNHREFGAATLVIEQESDLLDITHEGAKLKELNVWMSHGDRVEKLPENFVCIGSSQNAPIAAMKHESKPYYGLQFHPEVTHSEFGLELLGKFVHEICGSKSSWTPANIVEDAVKTIRETVGNDHVLLGLSGGVDSSVVAAL